MKQLSSIKLLFFIITIVFFSCRKNDIQIIIPDNSNPDLVTKVTTTISGFVTNENDEAMPGAIVRVGAAFLNTDQFGYFEIKNVEVNETAATFNVSKNGYFKLTKTFMAKEGKSSFFRIKLTPKTSIGTIDATTGGDASLSNGTTISLLADGVKNASTGTSYTGAITVSAHYIDPTAADIAGIMPGDLRGLRTNGDLNVLDSYGMLEVELTGASGELLQIADGKKATLTMSIPSSLTSTAPATIPLWYFDEKTGLWKEEGTANKVGNQYVGEVAHFSTWNCDNPHPHVPYHCRLVYSNGSPASNVEVRLIEENYYGGGTNHGFTDENGEIFGGVQANAQVRMEVSGMPFQNCANIIVREFTTQNLPVDMGDINMQSNNSYESHINGIVKECNGNPISNSRIILVNNGLYDITMSNSNGNYQFTKYLCNGQANVDFIAQSLNNSLQSTPFRATIIAGENTIPEILMCANNTSTVNINNQVWMTQNLNVSHYRNGDTIPEVQDPSEWANMTTGAWCYYNNDPVLGAIYGKLYNWYAVNDLRGLAPQGWHVPSDNEWTSFTNYLGGATIAGGKMKSLDYWNQPNSGATNSSGFSALPCGIRASDGSFGNLLGYTYMWSSDFQFSPNSYGRVLYLAYDWTEANIFSYQIKYGYSVRCLKD